MTKPLSAHQALAIFKHCPFPLLAVDGEGRVISYNGAFEQLIGRAQSAGLRAERIATLNDHPLLSEGTAVCWIDDEGKNHNFEMHRVDLPGENRTQARAEHSGQSLAL